MKTPDWTHLDLNDGVLPEPTPDGDRIILWLPRGSEGGFRYWERVGNVARAEVTEERSLCATPATSIQARQRVRGLFSKLLTRLGQPKGERAWMLPGGESAEQWGERRTDLMLVWAVDDTDPPDELRIKSRWPANKGVEPVGKRLFVVTGIESKVHNDRQEAAPPEGSPRDQAERLLVAARLAHDSRREASAQTDLGVVCLREGDAERAVTLLEDSLEKVRQLGERISESDVLVNLGSAVLALGQPTRALALMGQGLALAHDSGDRFAEKWAVGRLGFAYSGLNDPAQALAFYERALLLARELGDRQHAADLLWAIAIQHAELGQRGRAVVSGGESVTQLKQMGKPQARWFDEHLKMYRMGDATIQPGTPADAGLGTPPDALFGGSIDTSAAASRPDQQPGGGPATNGPGLLRMAFSAAEAMAKFLGSGLKTVDHETYQTRLRTCAVCDHHTGVRCRVCGCITSVKARLLHEDCPIEKWPS